MSVGRNDPCPCGSGQKYKKCCLLATQPKTEDLFWHRVHNARNGLINKILEHAIAIYGKAAVHEAWDEFHLWEGAPFDPTSMEMQLFMPWFFYHWTIDPENSDLNPDAPLDTPPARSLLENRGAYLDALERQYIQVCLDAPFTFIEVIECTPGAGFKVKDVLTGEELNVVEKRGSEVARIGDMIFGQPVTIQGLTTLEACSPFYIPPIFKGKLMDLRKHLQKAGKGQITHELLQEFSIELIETYQDLSDAILNPAPPILTNTDGDLIVPQKLYFEIDSPPLVFDALKDLNFVETEKSLLEQAQFDSSGNLKSVEFAWLKKGNKKNQEWNNTVMGHIVIEGHSLTVAVNSEKRAARFRRELKKRLTSGVRYKTTLIEPIESAIMKPQAQETEPSSIHSSHADPLHKNEEIQAKMRKMMEDHWSRWLHEKIPALGNKTPTQAAKTPEGRELLESLMTHFERSALQNPLPGQDLDTFAELRRKLSLTCGKP